MPKIKRIDPIAIAQELSQSRPLTTSMFAASATQGQGDFLLIVTDWYGIDLSYKISGSGGRSRTLNPRCLFLGRGCFDTVSNFSTEL